jgi:SAM-dependent methyltransferase
MADPEMWNQRYASEIYAYGKKPNTFLVKALRYLPLGNILSLGEGEGRNAVFLAEKGYRVLAVDMSAAGIKKTHRLARERSVSVDTLVSDLSVLNIEKKYWDGIINIFCHIPASIRTDLHHKIVDGLKPDGVYIMEAYSVRQLNYQTGGPRQLELLADLATVKEELDGLSFIKATEQERMVVEGQYHTGRGAVVQIIAKKPG